MFPIVNGDDAAATATAAAKSNAVCCGTTLSVWLSFRFTHAKTHLKGEKKIVLHSIYIYT